MNEKHVGSDFDDFLKQNNLLAKCETNGRKRLEEIAQRSQLTEADADRLADELKAEWWAANKDRFIPANQQ
jgi:hypothetical protein